MKQKTHIQCGVCWMTNDDREICVDGLGHEAYVFDQDHTNGFIIPFDKLESYLGTTIYKSLKPETTIIY